MEFYGKTRKVGDSVVLTVPRCCNIGSGVKVFVKIEHVGEE